MLVADNEAQQIPNRAKLICQVRGAELGFGLAIFILAELSPFIFLCRSKSFLGPVESLKGQSRTEDLVVKEILRRIYFKFGFDSSTPCLLLSGSNLGANLTPQSKAALPDTAPNIVLTPF